MHVPRSVDSQPLPGSDALKVSRLFEPEAELDYDAIQVYLEDGAHRVYLDNSAYDRYLRIPKGLIDQAGVDELQQLGAQLEQEVMPKYLDAAGWAYAEVGIASQSMSAVERVSLLSKAETLWERSLVNSLDISGRFGFRRQHGEDEAHRIAVNLAFAPLMKSIAIGDVRQGVMRKTLQDVAEIAQDSKLLFEEAVNAGDFSAAAFHRGFLFEASALMALLYIDDPRYVPMPATARGDSGYYYPKQSHDISVINQHWGDIKKVIPLEIKSSPSRRANRRYRALVVPGRVRLSISEAGSSETVDAFYCFSKGNASMKQVAAIEQLSTQLREMLRLYQRGLNTEDIALSGLTRFYDSREVAEVYPELSKHISRRYNIESGNVA